MLVDTTIGVDGRVTSADLLFSIPMLDATTLDAVRAWRFDPFVRDGRPLVGRTVFAIRFQEFGQVVETEAFDALADAMLLCLANLERARFEAAAGQCDIARREATMSIPARTRASRLLDDARFGHEHFPRADRLHADGRALADDGRHAEALRPYEEAERLLRRVHSRMPTDSRAQAGMANALTVLLSDYAVSLEAVGRTRDAERVRSRLKSLPR